MSCDHSHVPHALPQARNAYASTGPGLLGSSSSSDSSNSSITMPDSVQRSFFSATQSQFRRLMPSNDQSLDDLQTPPEPGHVAQALWQASNANLPFVPRAAHAFSRDVSTKPSPSAVEPVSYVQSRNKGDLWPSRARDWLARARESALGNIEVLARTLVSAARISDS